MTDPWTVVRCTKLPAYPSNRVQRLEQEHLGAGGGCAGAGRRRTAECVGSGVRAATMGGTTIAGA
jgi:hypothetical protein